MYNHEWAKLFASKQDDFRRLFNRDIADYADIQGGMHLGLNIVKLDEDLHGSTDYTGTEWEGMSMAERMEQERGREASVLVWVLLGFTEASYANTED